MNGVAAYSLCYELVAFFEISVDEGFRSQGSWWTEWAVGLSVPMVCSVVWSLAKGVHGAYLPGRERKGGGCFCGLKPTSCDNVSSQTCDSAVLRNGSETL